MKNAHKLFALLAIALFTLSCSPQSLSDDDYNPTIQTRDTGGDNSATIDDERDGE